MLDLRVGLRGTLLLLSFAALALAWRSAAPALRRGPYLQATSETGVTVVCQTAASSVATLRYGRHAGPPWEFESSSPAGTTHAFALTGLRPETRYSYELSADGAVLADGPGCSFRTAPPPESRAPFRFLAWGDSGTGSSAQMEVAARMEPIVPEPHFALGLGDLIYENGEWENYDPRLFRPYAVLFRRATFWPTLGNHDVQTEAGAPYLDAFYLPTTSGAPGHPSDTEKYYSFDHGMAHFACADSESTSSAPGGAMYTWLEDDLEHARARGQRWLFVFMHHPPYSHGTHDSDRESELMQLHDDLVPLFESKGVDMVLTGHSHVYERSYLAKDDAILQSHLSDYTKIGSPDGTLYLVSGCGGQTGSGALDHPLMARSFGNVAGFNVIDVSYEELHGSFVERDGRTTDLFRVRKSADSKSPQLAGLRARSASELEAIFDEPVEAGAGPAGAENELNYAIEPPLAVLGAILESDQRTVVLATASVPPDRVHELTVARVADLDGNDGGARHRFVLGTGGDGPATPIVPQGATWRFAKGTAAPDAAWNRLVFDDSGWSVGPAGFGYADGDDATVLADMRGAYVSVYKRIAFSVTDPARLTELTLLVSFDDGFVAFLNGTEIARENVALGQDHTTVTSSGHEAGTFESFDVGAFLSELRPGANVLALEGHNVSLDSNDFSLHAALSAVEASASGPPVAVLDTEVHTANAPARIAFSGARSSDANGPLSDVRWDFGDGTPIVHGSEVEHLYTSVGTYVVTLTVADGDGLESADQATLRLHAQGDAPLASFAPSRTVVAAGARVTFASSASRDPDGGTLYRDWDFGDPASGAANHSTETAPVHVFAAAGTYTVTLTVVDDEGSADVQQSTIDVGGGGGGSGGGGCSVVPTGGRETTGDASFALALASVLLVIVLRRRNAARTPGSKFQSVSTGARRA